MLLEDKRPRKLKHGKRAAPLMANGAHRNQKQAVQKARQLVLTQRILQLRVKGKSERDIAAQLVEEQLAEKMDRGQVHQLLLKALDEIQLPEVDQLKRLELERLDEIIAGHFDKA